MIGSSLKVLDKWKSKNPYQPYSITRVWNPITRIAEQLQTENAIIQKGELFPKDELQKLTYR